MKRIREVIIGPPLGKLMENIFLEMETF